MTFAWITAEVHGIAQGSYPSPLLQRPVVNVKTGGRVFLFLLNVKVYAKAYGGRLLSRGQDPLQAGLPNFAF